MLFSPPDLSARELEIIEQVNEIRSTSQSLLAPTRRWLRPLRRTTFARNVQASNSIEGHHVSLDDAIAAVNDGLPTDAEDEDFFAVRNYGDAMTYIVGLADDLHFTHSAELVRSLHFMTMKHDLAAAPGRWRGGPVYVWSTVTNESVYEGPPADEVPGLVHDLVTWMNEESRHHPTLVTGAMAHLNLVMIHPFKDGNGRMSRALQSLVLARDHILSPEFSSIEEYLGRNTAAYYDVLAAVGGGSWSPATDTRPWIRFVVTAHHHQALTVQRRLTEARRTWERLADECASRGLDERLITSVYLAATGRRVRRTDHIEFAEVSERVASADLKRLVDIGLLEAVGEKRGRFYIASSAVKEMRQASLEPRDALIDPFL